MQRTRQEASQGLLPEQREQLILERLRTHGRVLAAALAAELQTSEHTVRRHLRDLADQGHCKRVYGGALLISPANAPAAVRMGADVDRKARLAAAAATLVRRGQIVLLDAGSTNVAIASALPGDLQLTVVTNSPHACARLLERPGIEVLLIGGRIAAGAAGSLGATALRQVQQIRADLCFLGACAVDAQAGVAAFDAEDAELKRAMVEASGQIAIATTSEKLITAAPYSVAPTSAIDHLIVEADVSAERHAALAAVFDHVLVASA